MFGFNIGVDLGTTSVVMHMQGRGLVLSEPAIVAFNKRTGRLIAAGRDAVKMVGRTPEKISVLYPLADGAISNYTMTEQMLRYFLRKVCGVSIFKPKLMICIPNTLTSVEKRTVTDVAEAAGARRAELIEEAKAAAMGAGLDINEPHGVMVVDIGGGTTDVAVLTMGMMAVINAGRVGGNALNEAIARYVRRERGIEIGDLTAEDTKIRIGCAVVRREELEITVKGMSIGSGLPVSFEITSTEIYSALAGTLGDIAAVIQKALEDTPPELISDVLSDGITLTGGSALLYGMDKFISEKCGVPVRIADDPLGCVARGTLKALIALQKER